MKYLQIVMTVLLINLVLSLFASFNIFPINVKMVSTETFNDQGQPIDTQSLSYKVTRWQLDQRYITGGASDISQQSYLQSGTDFIRMIYWFWDVFVKGTLLVYPTLQHMGVENGIAYILICVPMYFMYLTGILQMIGGRSFAAMD